MEVTIERLSIEDDDNLRGEKFLFFAYIFVYQLKSLVCLAIVTAAA